MTISRCILLRRTWERGNDMAGNNSDSKQSRKDAKRDARIEAKRRKLAEQRAGRTVEPAVKAASPVQADAQGKRPSLFKRSGNKRNGGGFRWTPKLIAASAFALLVLIGIVWGALEIADYLDKKPEFIVTDEGFSHADKFDGCVPLNGIDVSVHQEGEINWERVKSSGVDFVFVRAGYRAADNGSLHKDENFDANMKGAEKAGLMVGAYFYSQALTPGEAKEEAEYVLDLVKDYDITMPLVIDYEIYEGGRLDKKIQAGELYAASFYHDIVLGFTNTVEAAGYESAVYANRSMLTNYMQADLIDDMATIWLAKYDRTADFDADYWFWQCSENGRSGGIEGSVDQNFWYIQPEKVYETRARHKKSAVSVRDCRISFRKSVTRLRNFRAVPKFDMTYDGKGMREGRDYISSVVHNTQSGTGYVIVRGIGKYKDWIMYPFEIE